MSGVQAVLDRISAPIRRSKHLMRGIVPILKCAEIIGLPGAHIKCAPKIAACGAHFCVGAHFSVCLQYVNRMELESGNTFTIEELTINQSVPSSTQQSKPRSQADKPTECCASYPRSSTHTCPTIVQRPISQCTRCLLVHTMNVGLLCPIQLCSHKNGKRGP
jgi:hypothetical protein